MNNAIKPAAPKVVETLENLLEERKVKTDRRELPEIRLPSSVERRKNKDRRSV